MVTEARKGGIGISDQVSHDAYAPVGMAPQIADGRHSKALLTVAGLLAALATSSCCLLPFIFVTVGVSGAWMGNLTALAPYQPMFFALAAASIGAGFHRVYRRPKTAACVPRSACADSRADRLTKAVLCSAAILAIAGMAIPWIVGLLVQA